MKLSLFGRMALALLATVALGLGMTACGGGTIGYLWVVGSQYNQIAGFKIDDYTGNLTQVPRSPFSVSGANPVSIMVRPGGRYVYVINQGTGADPVAKSKGSSSGISVFSVGGDGTLTYEAGYQSQGFLPMWAQMDSTGGFLYVLDKYSPNYQPDPTKANYDINGAITAFSIDSSTGRLQLVGNSQTQNGGLNTYFFEVGTSPFMMKSTGSCLFTLNSDQTVSPYSINPGTGQLTLNTTQTIPVTTNTATSINGNGSSVFITDSGNGGRIFPFGVGSNCSLTIFTGGSVANIAGTSNPTYSFVDNSGKYLYVLNQSTTTTGTPNPYSSISAFVLNSTSSQFTVIPGAPYTVGAGPVCMIEDQSNQYVYISNHNDGTVTGKVIDPTTGTLKDLQRGSTFPATGQAGCLGYSGNVS